MILIIRSYRIEDAPELRALFLETLRRVNARDYSAEQIQVWADNSIDLEAWTARFEHRFVIVAEHEKRVAGFAELEDSGRIDRFFVAADQQRVGVGRVLIQAIECEGRRRGIVRLWADVSLTAQPFFDKSGFTKVREQVVLIRGVELRNIRMEFILTPADC
jgi:putative acetyltransferase